MLHKIECTNVAPLHFQLKFPETTVVIEMQSVQVIANNHKNLES
jgi:hypothetical protein